LPSTTRWAKEHRVVLGPAAEDLNGSLDFVLAADHGIQFLLARQLGQVPAEAVERRCLAAAAFAFAFTAFFAASRAAAAAALAAFGPFQAVAEQIEHFLADFLELETEIHEHLGRHAFLLPQQA
jgi:hypothetical protein